MTGSNRYYFANLTDWLKFDVNYHRGQIVTLAINVDNRECDPCAKRAAFAVAELKRDH